MTIDLAIESTTTAHLHARLHPLHDAQPQRGKYVVYWMQQARRRYHNFALQHAVFRAREHKLPLVVVEDLSLDQRWIGHRHFAFALRGMQDNAADFADLSWLHYLPVIEQQAGELLDWSAEILDHAAELITEYVPCGLPQTLVPELARQASERGIRAMAVDTNGLFPVNMVGKACPSAAVFRRHVHRHAGAALAAMPQRDPCDQVELPAFRQRPRWRRYAADKILKKPALLADLPLDHEVAVIAQRGGRKQGLVELEQWVTGRTHICGGLSDYGNRNQPDSGGASGLSPYLHWGHISCFDVIDAVTAQDPSWDLAKIPEKGGKRLGFWPLAESSQLLFDELITWRELAYQGCEFIPDYDQYHSLPEWALATLAEHATDHRPLCYTHQQFENSETDDLLWNAIQRQLREDGIIHNYLRMLWAKCILYWSPSPEQAFETLVELNNRWALDGRNPNSYAGITWCLGRYDHGWPEREIFGKVRSMTIASTSRKLDLQNYLARYG